MHCCSGSGSWSPRASVGQGPHPRTALPPRSSTYALLVNGKGAADALWRERGYDSMRPD